MAHDLKSGVPTVEKVAVTASQQAMSARVNRSLMLVTLAAGIEGATGIALLVLPALVLWLLLGVAAGEPWLTVARVCGSAMVALAISCWPNGDEPAGAKQLAAMLFYNAVVSGVLLYGGLAAAASGMLLWPVLVLHVVLSGLFVKAWCQQ